MESHRTVHIVDDDHAIRSSTGLLLRQLGYRVQTWPSGQAFLQGFEGSEPGVVLLDLRMPDVDGLAVQRALSITPRNLPIVFYSGHGDVDVAVHAVRAGAVDFIEKPAQKEILVEALDRAFEALEANPGHFARAEVAQQRFDELTAREQEVLVRLARGFTNRSTASDLGISPRTIEVHRANIMKKLRARTFSDALRTAFEAGIV